MSARESMSFDVVIVGAGVAGLAAAIRLKQLARREGRETSVVVLEKGAHIGAHVISGAIIDPIGLDLLLPYWRHEGAPLVTAVGKEHLYWLSREGAHEVPRWLIPDLMRHEGGYIGSLGALTRWLGEEAARLGVEIYPGFAASELLYGKDGAVVGVATPDQGLDPLGNPTPSHQRGMELKGNHTLLAEGARGFLAQQAIARFGLDQNAQPQKYALGLKELWQVRPEHHQPGLVSHMSGWPLARGVHGGGFVYHYGENLVALGLVVHLDYKRLETAPFDLLQRFKTHGMISPLLEGGKRIGYGARAIAAGGWQSLPQAVFPGGALIGCAAGLMNFARLQGSHNAMQSGMLAARACHDALAQSPVPLELTDYRHAFAASSMADELKKARNLKPLIERYGKGLGGALGFADLWGRRLFGCSRPTFTHKGPDRAPITRCRDRIPAPEADGRLTFDKPSSLQLAGVVHDENQPPHIVFKDPLLQMDNRRKWGCEPAPFYCPAGVFEQREDDKGERYLHISAANCLHCKTCDIKDPGDNIRWLIPAGGGPHYVDM